MERQARERGDTDGGDYEAPISDIPGLIADPSLAATTLTAPPEAGAYRLFAYAYDGKGHAAHANIPFRVDHAP